MHELLHRRGVQGGQVGYNPSWYDWINLEGVLTVSCAIRDAAQARTD